MKSFHKIFAVLPAQRQRQIPLIVCAMVMGAAFEVLGISLVMPMLDIISGNKNDITRFLGSFFTENNGSDVAIVSVIAFAAIYTIKGFYLSYLAWLIAKFTYSVKADVSNNLIEKYLTAPYEFHLKRNSAQLIRNLTIESVQLGQSVLSPLLVIISESVVIIAIAIFLLVIEPFGTTVLVSLLLALSYSFQRMLGDYTKKIGQVRQHADGMLMQYSQEALGGIKDVKVLGKEVQFRERFSNYNIISANVSAKQQTFSQLPRMYLETIGVIVFSFLIFIFILRGDEFGQILSVLGVFALSAFRLLPSANRILTAINAMRFADSVLNKLYKELAPQNLPEGQTSKSSSALTHIMFEKRIEIENLYYRYPETRNLALSNISFSIQKGESVGIVGKSGSGKTTLTDTILGLLTPTSGAIKIDGVNIENNLKEWQRLIGYVQQEIFLIDDTIQRNIAFGDKENEIDLEKVSEALLGSQLKEFVESLPEGINTKLGERGVRLSGGQKQRIGIARALYRNSPILIFDEATSALDSETESEIVSAIKRFKGLRTTIVIAHRLSTIEHCDLVIELKNGQISNIKN